MQTSQQQSPQSVQSIAQEYFENPTDANFERYYKAFRPIAIAAAGRQTRDKDITEIAISDFFMKMRSKALGESEVPFIFDPTKSHKSFIFTSIQRSAITKAKRQARDVFINDFSESGEADDASSSTFEGILLYNSGSYYEIDDADVETPCLHNDKELQVQKLREIVEEMGFDEPTTMALLETDGLTQKEITQIFPDKVSSEGALKTRVFRAKDKVAEKFSYFYNLSVLADGGSSVDFISPEKKVRNQTALEKANIVFNPL